MNSTESDFFDDAELILTASRMSKPLEETPASVSVIDRQMIESSGVREIADIFRLVPGFIVGNHTGNTPVVTYHGLGDVFIRQLQVLVDGRSVFVPSFGGVPWTNLPLLLEDIERVEIIRGPNAVTYGANAFLATINIITRHSSEDLGSRYSLTTSGGSNPEAADAYLRLGYHLDNLDWRLSLGTLNDDGFESVNDSRETNKLNFRLDYQAGYNQFWTFHLGTSRTDSGKGIEGDPLSVKRDDEATNSYININWERVRENGSTSVRLTHTVQEVIDEFMSGPISLGTGLPDISLPLDFGRDSNRTDLEFIQTEELDNSLRFVYGASIRRDQVQSQFLTSNNRFHDIDTGRLFSSVEWRLGDNWILDFGTTLEDSSITEQEYSPRLSVLRRLNPNHMLRFVASRAKRNPVLYEHSGLTVYSTSINIPPFGPQDIDIKVFEAESDIEPEDILSYEIGLRSQYLQKSVSTDIKLFTYEITDFISIDEEFEELDPLLGVIEVGTARNKGGVEVSGLELAIDVSPSTDFNIKSGFSFVSVDSISRRLEATFPDSTAFVTGEYRWQDRHSASASLYYIDDMEWGGLADPIPSISKLDLRYAFLLDKDSETQIELVGRNLLEEYEDYLERNISERTYLLRISGGF